jgi:hypothetical protein
MLDGYSSQTEGRYLQVIFMKPAMVGRTSKVSAMQRSGIFEFESV